MAVAKDRSGKLGREGLAGNAGTQRLPHRA